MNNITITVEKEFEGLRLDKWLAEQDLNLTRTALQGLIENGSVLVNNKKIAKNYKQRNADIITISIPEPEKLDVIAEDIPIKIVYEDDHLLVVNKPKGMVVHPAVGNYNGTLVNALLYCCEGKLSSINGVIRPGIVHRIDKNTSGLLIVAKNDKAHLGLSEQIKSHSFTREYESIVWGHFKDNSGTIDLPIGRSHFDRKKMCVTERNSKNAITHYEVIADYRQYTHLRIRLETGRTHQIRVHMSYAGHPVLGDDVYGKAYKGIDGQCLHAKKIGFIHPITEEYMEFDSPLPDYFIDMIRRIGN
ncbi:MAG TPA: RluA family pseudouridine synthase [Clostridiales bacterium]|nr:RluA family pseudouridine synthase [Clostridiales bacterium]